MSPAELAPQARGAAGRTPRGVAWAWLAALCVFLASPPLISGVALIARYRALDPLLVWVAVMSVVWLLALHVLVPRTFWLHVAMAPLYLLTAADLFVLWKFEARLTSSYLSIIFTDHGDTGEFVRAYVGSLVAVLSALAILYALGLRSLRRHEVRAPRWVKLTAIAALAVGYLGPVARQSRKMPFGTAVLDVAAHDLSSPVGGVVQTGVTIAHLRQTQEFLGSRRAFSFGATREPGVSPDPEIYVMVIGESARADRWSLAGYERETNPLLSRIPNVVFLRDYVATGAHTAVAVPALMSLAPITRWRDVQAQRSFVSAFREAGFTTRWLSTQEVDSWGGIVNQIAAEANGQRYFSRSLDDVLLDALGDILMDPARPAKLMVVLHTRGNHFGTTKYPPEFRRWPDVGGTWVTNTRNAYDNGILFTDSILARVIELVRAQGVKAAVVYAADHGENLADVDDLYGHGIGNRYDLSAAALFWYSEALGRAEPARIAAGRAHASARVGHDNVGHSILDLARIRAPALELARSIFSDRFQEEPTRRFIARGVLQDYDEMPRPAAAPRVQEAAAAEPRATAGRTP